MGQSLKSRGWRVALAGTGINLALGILYTWSIFKGAIKNSIEAGGPGSFQWDMASINDPYAVCCLVFAFAMIVAGKVQDRFGPRLTALLGGLLVGAGFVWISQSTSYWSWVAGFGVLAGLGIGFGYSAATPPALKWFPPAKTGLIAGVVVSGFGLASVYIAPLATYLVGAWGLQKAMLGFGLAFAVVVSALSTFLVNPPEGFLFGEAADQKAKAAKAGAVGEAGGGLQTLGDGPQRQLLHALGAVLHRLRRRPDGDRQRGRHGEEEPRGTRLRCGGPHGRGQRGGPGGRRHDVGQDRPRPHAAGHAGRPGRPDVRRHPGGGARASPLLLVLLATFIGFNYGTNLSLVPVVRQGLLGPQELRHELRRALQRLGRERVRDGARLPDADREARAATTCPSCSPGCCS